MEKSITREKAKKFAVKIVRLCQVLQQNNKEFIISKQLIRCGTSVGANLMESEHAASGLDFVNKLNISLKEANETKYWLELLVETDYISQEKFLEMKNDCDEILRLLAASIKTMKSRL